MEKDRARQELRALLPDPAAGFAAPPGSAGGVRNPV